ncbi:MAG: carbohydrate ABC transporter permease [Caldilineaceae bacterium]|nr:carbohydrate ABC transporter permease [Caldilineaceae bacterium]
MSQPAVLPTTTRTYHDYPRLLTRAVQVLVTYLGLLLVGFIFMVPLLWMLTTALKPLPDIFKIPPVWLPNPPQWQQLWEPWIQRDFTLYFGNTLQIALLSVVGEVLVSSLVAYAFARLRWPGRDLFFVLTLSAMMLPMQVRLIPLFLIFKQLGWINTHLPLIVPHFFGGAFEIFLLRQNFRGLPRDLDDSAKIDGASYFRIYWNILLPLVKPALAAVGIFTFMNQWNAFLTPLIYLSERKKYVLAIGLSVMRDEFQVDWSDLMAISFLVTLLPLVVFFVAQKYFIQGVTMTGLKG